jgi:hypothetical protein
MHDNERGFHGRNSINQATPATCDTPTPMSRKVGIGNEMGPGILGAPLNADPHGRGFKSPIGDAPSSRRPVGEPTEMKPPHDPDPHPYTPAAQKQLPNTYARPRFER